MVASQKGMAAQILLLLLAVFSGWMLQGSHGMVVGDTQHSRFISAWKDRAREEWHRSMQGGLVSLMSVLAPESERVLRLPNLPMLASQLGLNTFVVDEVKVGLTGTLSAKGPMTLLGPTDDAFSTAPDWLKVDLSNDTKLMHILQFHILKEKIMFADIKDELTVNTHLDKTIRFNIYPQNVVTAQCAALDVTNVDKKASNGVLHELKQVIIPSGGNIIQAMTASELFSTFVGALQTAGLDLLLSGGGPFTVFAPTDQAFSKLDPQKWQNVLNNETALIDLLEYHVASKTYCSVGLCFYTSLQMLNGEQVNIIVDSMRLKINNAVILPVGVDSSVSNGVVHAIDTVLLPGLQQDFLQSPSWPVDQQG